MPASPIAAMLIMPMICSLPGLLGSGSVGTTIPYPSASAMMSRYSVRVGRRGAVALK